MAFFTSWALWEKMTFVLALAILGVFGIGYSKLAWQNRILRRHRLADEEKRLKIAELQRSGQVIELRKSQDVPFGIRAIQSGIRIDGIWVSTTSTLLQSIPKPGQLPRKSFDLSSSTSNTRGSNDASRIAARGSTDRSSLPQTEYKPSGSDSDSRSLSGTRTQYQPRRSSYLRYGTYGEVDYDEETLDQLEGNVIPMDPGTSSQSTYLKGGEMNITTGAVADNNYTLEKSRHSVPSDKNEMHVAPERLSLPQWSVRSDSLLPPFWNKSPQSLEASRGNYFSLPLHSPEDEAPEHYSAQHYISSETPLSFMAPNAQNLHGFTATAASKVPLLEQASSPLEIPSPFVPGELHVNTTTRKVNSGFEVLPAGTFGTHQAPLDLKEKRADRDGRWSSDDDKRPSKKLQKKTRTSMTSARNSSTMDWL